MIRIPQVAVTAAWSVQIRKNGEEAIRDRGRGSSSNLQHLSSERWNHEVLHQIGNILIRNREVRWESPEKMGI